MWDWLTGTLTPNPVQAPFLLLIGAIGIAALIVALLTTLFRYRQHASKRDSGIRRYPRRLRRYLRLKHLSHNDLGLLEELARNYGVREPLKMLTEIQLVSNLLKRAILFLDSQPNLSENERQRWLTRYFQLEERLDYDEDADRRRKSRRRIVDRVCTVTPVITTDGKHQAEPSVLAHTRRTMGTVMDISIGGCSVHSLAPFKEGNMTTVEVELNSGASINVEARIQGVRPQWPAGTIVHLQFTKLSPENRNRIHRYVYRHGKSLPNEQVSEPVS